VTPRYPRHRYPRPLPEPAQYSRASGSGSGEFPVAARIQTELITLARAAENRVYLLTANRVGKERWAEFCGWSQIVDPYGGRLAEADETSEALLVSDVEIEKARDKDYVVPGDYELYLFGDRRPELYGALVEESVPIET
jgi:5-aminopentanamidase